MKKLLALILTLVMAVTVFGTAFAEAVDAANIADQPEFDVMTLGNYKYKEDYISLYDQVGSGITIADVEEDEDLPMQFQVSSIPCIVFFDRQGQMVQRLVGLQPKSTLEQAIQKLL